MSLGTNRALHVVLHCPGLSIVLMDHFSLFLQTFDRLLKEVSVLLEALDKRQIEFEKKNERLKEDLTEAACTIEKGAAARKEWRWRTTSPRRTCSWRRGSALSLST